MAGGDEADAGWAGGGSSGLVRREKGGNECGWIGSGDENLRCEGCSYGRSVFADWLGLVPCVTQVDATDWKECSHAVALAVESNREMSMVCG